MAPAGRAAYRLSSLTREKYAWSSLAKGTEDTMLEWTGERFIPGEGGAALLYEHAHRYRLAQSLAAGRRVVDLASGEGYGSDLLAQHAKLVVGLELDGQAVTHAAKKYQRDNLRFVRADIRFPPLREGQTDLVVCFEAIEHVTQPEVVLTEARRLLRPDGVLVISTPERKEHSEARGLENKFHEHEFYQDEFRTFLEDAFPCVEIFGQRVIGASATWPLTGATPPSALEIASVPRWRSSSEAGTGLPPPHYCIAVCGGPEAFVRDRLSRSLFLLLDPDQQWTREHDQVVETRANLEYRVLELETHDELLLSMKNQLVTENDWLNDELVRSAARAQALKDELELLYESTSWRITRPVRALSRLLSWRRRAS